MDKIQEVIEHNFDYEREITSQYKAYLMGIVMVALKGEPEPSNVLCKIDEFINNLSQKHQFYKLTINQSSYISSMRCIMETIQVEMAEEALNDKPEEMVLKIHPVKMTFREYNALPEFQGF